MAIVFVHAEGRIWWQLCLCMQEAEVRGWAAEVCVGVEDVCV